MAQEVKIITFINDREGREDGEERLSQLVTDGWDIKAAGGSQGAGMVWGFVVLQREKPDAPAGQELLEDNQIITPTEEVIPPSTDDQ